MVDSPPSSSLTRAGSGMRRYFSEHFPPWRACKVEVRYPPPPQKGYLSDTCATPYDNKANGCDTPLCDTISKGSCAIWGGISHWAAKTRNEKPQRESFRGGCPADVPPSYSKSIVCNFNSKISTCKHQNTALTKTTNTDKERQQGQKDARDQPSSAEILLWMIPSESKVSASISKPLKNKYSGADDPNAQTSVTRGQCQKL